MRKRSGKFYRRNEADTMERLGLSPTKNSGSGWVEKEDGYSDAIICQLKSTDAKQITVKLEDLKTLVYNSLVSHKVPVFAIQFLQTDDIWLLVRPGDLKAATDGLGVENKGRPENSILDDFSQSPAYDEDIRAPNMVKSDAEARERFAKERDEERKRRWGRKN